MLSMRPVDGWRRVRSIVPSLNAPNGLGVSSGAQLALELGGSGGTEHAAAAWSAFSFLCCALTNAERCFVLLCVRKYAAGPSPSALCTPRRPEHVTASARRCTLRTAWPRAGTR